MPQQQQLPQNESIYNLLYDKKGKEPPKKVMYRSKYDPKAPLTGSTLGLHGTTVTVGKGIHELKRTSSVSSTFGPRPNMSESNGARNNPSNFLRKGSRSFSQNKLSEKKKQCVDKTKMSEKNRKPSVPFRDDKPVLGLKTCKNFITSNAVDMILSSQSNSQKKNKWDENENFLEKENYGKVPDYLKDVKEQISRENELIDQYVMQQSEQQHQQYAQDKKTQQQYDYNDIYGGKTSSGFTSISSSPSGSSSMTKNKSNNNGNMTDESVVMDENDRQELIQKLRDRWDHVNSNYQKICHRVVMETPGDVRRKNSQEAELKQLEDDIALLTKPGPIIIRSS